MKRYFAGFAGVVLVFTVALLESWPLIPKCGTGETVRAAEAPVTFTRQIAPILYKNCGDVPSSGRLGPFSLLTYQDAVRRGKLIETVTQSRYMPPWLPEPGYGEFAESRRLPDADVARSRSGSSLECRRGTWPICPRHRSFPAIGSWGHPTLS